MAITSIKTGSSFTNLIKYNDFLGPNPAYIPSSYESIATATGTGSSNTITFNSIPGTYKHLQIRGMVFATTTGGVDFGIRLNSATSTYRHHYLSGNGSLTEAGGTSTNVMRLLSQAGIGSTTYPAPFITDIHDYTSTTKTKVIRNFVGQDTNNTGTVSGTIELSSGLWTTTDAITSISLIMTNANFATSTVISLYGIKA
jgi:hypothetical protein